jgi:hypothetical protein
MDYNKTEEGAMDISSRQQKNIQIHGELIGIDEYSGRA